MYQKPCPAASDTLLLTYVLVARPCSYVSHVEPSAYSQHFVSSADPAQRGSLIWLGMLWQCDLHAVLGSPGLREIALWVRRERIWREL